MTSAILFDIDGTLVDSNYLHVEAWSHAFFEAGLPVDQWRVHRGIGMDSGKLLEELVPDASDEAIDTARTLNTRYYEELLPRLRAFDGARELLAELAARGATVVLATSAPDNELEQLRALLDVEDSIAHVTSAGDVETAKPEPDILLVALEKAGADATTSFMIGDSVWDMVASGRAGTVGIGVLSGGFSEAELRDAGAIAVYRDVADLFSKLDSSPLGALLD
jgi:HAD superfamily hydrolase (TIGR01509 family)